MRTLLTTTLLAVALPCQASFVPFGTGCPLNAPLNNGQTPAIGNTGLPQIGQSFSIDYRGPNYTYNGGQQIAQPHLALGFQALVTQIPAGILLYQPAGCTGYLAPIAVIPMQQDPVLPQYEDRYRMAIPSDPSFIGLGFLAQWVLVHQQCGFVGCSLSGFITSDAATVTIGV